MKAPVTTTMDGSATRIRLLRAAAVRLRDGQRRELSAGEIVQVSGREADRLISSGFAEQIAVAGIVEKSTAAMFELPGQLLVVKSQGGRRSISCTASTAAVDRMGDVVEPAGWKLEAYRRNPVVLAGHDHGQPIARAERVAVERGALVADIEFPEPGVSPDADRTWSLIAAGVLRGVSVGFAALKAEPLSNGGLRFLSQELLEISIVAVPANPEALLDAPLARLPQRGATTTAREPVADRTAAPTPRLTRARLLHQIAVGREGRAQQRAAAIAEEAAADGRPRLAKRAAEASRPRLTACTAELARLHR